MGEHGPVDVARRGIDRQYDDGLDDEEGLPRGEEPAVERGQELFRLEVDAVRQAEDDRGDRRADVEEPCGVAARDHPAARDGALGRALGLPHPVLVPQRLHAVEERLRPLELLLEPPVELLGARRALARAATLDVAPPEDDLVRVRVGVGVRVRV